MKKDIAFAWRVDVITRLHNNCTQKSFPTFARGAAFVSHIFNASSECLHMSLSILTLGLGNLASLANEYTSKISNMIGCFSPISPITVFLASLKYSSSTSDANASTKWSSSSSKSVVSSDSCRILDRYWGHNLEKKPSICMLDNYSVLSNILSPSIVQAVRISFATFSGFGFCQCLIRY